MKLIRKSLRIGVWTLCCISLTIFFVLLIQKPRGFAESAAIVLNIDPFLKLVELFICVIAAFIVDLWYVARFD